MVDMSRCSVCGAALAKRSIGGKIIRFCESCGWYSDF